MRIDTFLKIAALIILAGIVTYLVTPKFVFDSHGSVRKNRFTGMVERWEGHYWDKRENRYTGLLADLGGIPVKELPPIPKGFVLEDQSQKPTLEEIFGQPAAGSGPKPTLEEIFGQKNSQ